jgi:hypothetical protein
MNRGHEVPVAVSIGGDGVASIRLADQAKVEIEEMKVQGSQIMGSFRGQIAGHPHFAQDHDMRLTLTHDDGRLYGYITSDAETEFGSVSTPFYVRLVKQE